MSAANPGRGSAISGRTVLLRADFTNGVTEELGRMAATFAARGARVAVLAGYGAPQGEANTAFSLAQFRPLLEHLCGRPVTFISDCVGADAEAGLGLVPFGEVALMENLRFHPDERRNNRTFAMRLSALGDYFAISGAVPPDPVGWLTALAAMLPTPTLASHLMEE